MVQAPSLVGVKVAVYTVELDSLKSLIVPPETEISLAAKLVVASLEVNIKLKVASLDVSPSFTSVAVMVMVGTVPSPAIIVSL